MSTRCPSDDDFVTVERQSPEEVFGLLANDLRAEILEAMMDAPAETVSFSDLYDRVEADDSGQFNYHLGRLTGHFVRRTEDGYELTHAGTEVVGAIYAGTYTADTAIEPLSLGERCITCGGTLYIEYAAESAWLSCGDCDRESDRYFFPARGLDQFTREELPAAIGRWMDHYNRGLIAGFCPICTGRVDGELVIERKDRLVDFPAHVEFECRRCGMTHATPGTVPVHTHPSVRQFLFDQGFDRHAPIWEILDEVGRPETELQSRTPPRLAVTLSLGDERITAVVDERAHVVEVVRHEDERQEVVDRQNDDDGQGVAARQDANERRDSDERRDGNGR